MARINIIVPVYNAEKYLDKCIQSLITQTAKDIEIILIDDNSTDKSLEILKRYEELYPNKIKVIHNEINIGAGASRNKGLILSDSEYVGFVDSDDFVNPIMYQSLSEACKETGLSIARCNRKIVYKNINLSFVGRNCNIDEKKIIIPKKQIEYLSMELPCATNKIFRRDLIGDRLFPENLKWEDYPFSVPLLYNTNGVATVTDAMYYYNINLDGTTLTDTMKLPLRLLDIFTCSDQIKSEILTEDSSEKLRDRVNLVAIQNCLQRARDVLYSSDTSIKEKKELISLVSALITKKYGEWKNNPLFLQYKGRRILYNINMWAIENFFTDEKDLDKKEETIESEIKKILAKRAINK